jgi:vacuolar-type H+-ATPase subunit H
MLSDIIADVKGQTHGCINSSISDDIDRNFAILHDVNEAAAKILQDRLLNIALREQSSIDQFIQKRDDLISKLINEGRSYVNQYEEDYRRLIQKFITTLEIEMSKHLDYLQNQIEADKESIFRGVNVNIQHITRDADKARGDFHRLLQQAAAAKRQEIIDLIETISKDKTSQPLGYEQLKKINVEIYSTVGMKNDGQGCDNIPDRGKFIREIDRVKPPPPRITRTVYIEPNVDQQQANRNKDS